MPEKLTLSPEVVAALRGGNKIEAIRLIREKSGIGLAEAKAVVDAFEKVRGFAGGAGVSIRKKVAMERESAPQRAGLSPGEVPRSGGAWKAAIVVAVLVVLAILWARHG
ncbi:MAG TPA: ribosomal protein L7/L12 [Usitatibacter sp.]|jgi:hypothetical protein|nr:ribosomal protein L7/L12 [Usitatibacter sp.]